MVQGKTKENCCPRLEVYTFIIRSKTNKSVCPKRQLVKTQLDSQNSSFYKLSRGQLTKLFSQNFVASNLFSLSLRFHQFYELLFYSTYNITNVKWGLNVYVQISKSQKDQNSYYSILYLILYSFLHCLVGHRRTTMVFLR